MSESSDALIIEESPTVIRHALRRLVDLSLVRLEINPPTIVERVSPATGGKYREVHIRIVTDNRPLILGQFMDLEMDGLVGYHPNYLFGFLHAHFEQKGIVDVWDNYYFVVDVHHVGPQPDLESLYKFITVDEAMGRGLVTPDAKLAKLLKLYDLRYVLTSGQRLSGPSSAMMEVVREVAWEIRGGDVIDLFAGSGALSRVALQEGCGSATCLDLNINEHVLRANMGPFWDRCRIEAQDAFDFVAPDSPPTLVLVDVFFEFTRRAVVSLLPRLRSIASRIVINVGPPAESYWVGKLEHEIERLSLPYEMVHRENSLIAVCRS
jgi:hypothetical protein